jgi:pimeloyl-ACP methyl ester carboxylesterase
MHDSNEKPVADAKANQVPEPPGGTELDRDAADCRKSRRRRGIVLALKLASGLYVVLLFGMIFGESRLLFPGAYLPLRSAEHLPGVESFEYPTVDGTVVTGRIVERPNAKRHVLFLHGNGVRAPWIDRWAVQLSRTLDATVLIAEFRGFQFEDVAPSETNLIKDTLAAHDAFQKRYGLQAGEMVVFGRSLGGGCAAALAEQRHVGTLVLDRTFDAAVNVAASKFAIFPVHLLMKNRFDSVERLQEFSGRVIQLHGHNDRVVPFQFGWRLHESLRTQDKHFLRFADLPHNRDFTDETLQRVAELLDAEQLDGQGRAGE